MNENEMEQLSCETISQDLRRELERRRSYPPDDNPSTAAVGQIITLPRLNGPPDFDRQRQAYHLNDFLNYHDRDFVLYAYLGILKRPPDSEGMRHFLDHLRSGRLEKVEIIGRLRFSKEGKGKKVKVHGLLPVLAVCLLGKLPILGYLSRWWVILLRLPVVVGNLTRFEAHGSARDATLREHMVQLGEQLEAILRKQAEMLARLEVEKATVEGLGELGTELDNVSETNRMTNRQVTALREAVADEVVGNRQQFQNLFSEQRLLAERLGSKAEVQDLLAGLAKLAKRQGADREELAGIKAALAEEGAGTRRQVKELFSEQRLLAERLGSKAEVQDLLAGLAKLAERQGADREELAGVKAALAEEGVGTRRQVKELFSQQQRLSELLGGKAEEKELRAGLSRLSARQAADQEQLATLVAQVEVVSQEVTGGSPPITLPTDIEALYVAFEERFRGSRALIRSRQQVYLPLFEQLRASISGGDIVDLGCGRGEWLELLAEQGFSVCGVDMNRLMVDQCRSLGVAAMQAEALAFLQAEANDSLAAITAFHLIEHLSFPHLLALFTEVKRVLKPGGLVLFETPNPENILVGSFFFHTDPTHRQPLAPDSLSFYMNYLGFTNVDLIRLHHYAGQEQIKTANAFQQQWIESAMDFAVFGYKP